jgi:hypothetical protein
MNRPTYDVVDGSEVQPSPEGIGSVASSPVAEFRISIVAPVEAGDSVGSDRAEGNVTSRIRWRTPESLRTKADASSGWSAAAAAREATKRRATNTALVHVVGSAHTYRCRREATRPHVL